MFYGLGAGGWGRFTKMKKASLLPSWSIKYCFLYSQVLYKLISVLSSVLIQEEGLFMLERAVGREMFYMAVIELSLPGCVGLVQRNLRESCARRMVSVLKVSGGSFRSMPK